MWDLFPIPVLYQSGVGKAALSTPIFGQDYRGPRRKSSRRSNQRLLVSAVVGLDPGAGLKRVGLHQLPHRPSCRLHAPILAGRSSKFSATRLRGTWDRLFGCACTVWRVFPLTWRPSAPNLQHKRHGEGGTKDCPVACESRLCKQECRTGRTGEGSQSAWVPNLIVCVCASSCL